MSSGPFPSLTIAYSSAGIPNSAQRTRVMEKINELLPTKEQEEIAINQFLEQLYTFYSSGGISVGRSARSVLLDAAIANNIGDKNILKEILSYLLAMYHNPEYVNENKWYDYDVISFLDISARERNLLVALARILEIDNLPEISSQDNPHKILESLKEKNPNL